MKLPCALHFPNSILPLYDPNKCIHINETECPSNIYYINVNSVNQTINLVSKNHLVEDKEPKLWPHETVPFILIQVALN